VRIRLSGERVLRGGWVVGGGGGRSIEVTVYRDSAVMEENISREEKQKTVPGVRTAESLSKTCGKGKEEWGSTVLRLWKKGGLMLTAWWFMGLDCLYYWD